jgi:hypothetical protein
MTYHVQHAGKVPGDIVVIVENDHLLFSLVLGNAVEKVGHLGRRRRHDLGLFERLWKPRLVLRVISQVSLDVDIFSLLARLGVLVLAHARVSGHGRLGSLI